MNGLEIGHNVELVAGDQCWISKVVAISPEALTLSPPEDVRLNIGDGVQLSSLTGDFLHRYVSRVIQVFPHLIVEPPRFEEAGNQRAFVRVPDQLPMTVIHQLDGLPRSAQVETSDLSAGGVGFAFQGPLEGRLTLILTLPTATAGKTQQLRLLGQVRRNVPLGTRTHVGVEWQDMSEQEENAITQYIFRRMRALFRRS